MLAIRCPLCNAVAPVAVASPHLLECEACGGRSDVPEPAQAQLRAAAKLLKTTNTGSRRLSKAQRQALLSADEGREVLGLIHGVFILAALVWAGATLSVASGVDYAPIELGLAIAMGILPLALIVGSAWRGFRMLGRRRAELVQLCSAVPSNIPGAPHRCRVCAAPITTEGTRQVARCGYCGADNIVTVDVLKRAIERHREAATDLEAEVRASLTDVNAAARSAWVRALVSALFAPIAALVGCFVLMFVVMALPAEVDATREYVVIKEDGELCLAAVVGPLTIERRRGEEGYDLQRTPLATGLVHERSPAAGFVGRKARVISEPKTAAWTITEVQRLIGSPNHVVFAEPEAPTLVPLERLCLAGESPQPANPAAR